jgi:hypothetical protein
VKKEIDLKKRKVFVEIRMQFGLVQKKQVLKKYWILKKKLRGVLVF